MLGAQECKGKKTQWNFGHQAIINTIELVVTHLFCIYIIFFFLFNEMIRLDYPFTEIKSVYVYS